MFAATTHQVVRSLGKDSLIPVPSIDQSDNFKPLAVLLTERRRRFFWKRTRYLTTEFSLDDILNEALCKDSASKEDIVRSRELAKFDYETNLSLNGKFGVDLQKEFLDLEIDGSDNTTVKSQLGELRKEEVNLPAFLSLTKERRINLHHQLVAPLISDSSKILCVVTGVVQLVNAGTLIGEIKEGGSEKVTCTIPVCSSAKGTTETGEVSETKTKKLEVPAGTALAYCVRELLVSSVDGQFHIVLDTSCHGGFVPYLEAIVDETDEPPSDSLMKTLYSQGILSSSEIPQENLKVSVLEILKLPKAIGPLDNLLHEAAIFIEMNILKTTLLSILQDRIPSLDASLLPFLFLAGFTLQEEDTIVYPTSSSEMFEACELLITLLNDLEDDQLAVTQACIKDRVISREVLQMLSPVLGTGTREIQLEGDSSLLQTDISKKLQEAFGLEVQDLVVSLPQDNLVDIQALCLVLLLTGAHSDDD